MPIFKSILWFLKALLSSDYVYRDNPIMMGFDGKKVTKYYTDFNHENRLRVIHADSVFDVTMDDGDTVRVIVPSNCEEYIKVKINCNTIWVTMDNTSLNVKFELEKVNISKGDFRVILPKKYCAITSVHLSGAASFEGDIETPQLNINMKGASDFEGEINAHDVFIDCSGASSVDISGSCKQVQAFLSGSSDVDAEYFTAEYGTLKLSGNSDCRIKITDSVKCNCTGASDCTIYGHPNKHDITTSGAAECKH